MRYLSSAIEHDLHQKMVFLSGPRQSGKTTLAKNLLGKKGVYLNWDIRKDQRLIREIAWPKDASLVVLDEIHKFLRWKNFLKGVADEFKNDPPLLVTGSAKLDTFRRQGDALTGRYFSYRLHPIDVAESKLFLPGEPAKERTKRLLEAGGFPEAFLNPKSAERLRNDRFDLVVQEDLRDISKQSSVRGLQLLIELLRERVGQRISFGNLAKDLSVSAPTVKAWIEILEKLYIVFLVRPYAKGFSRSLRKEPKLFFYDCAAAHDESARLENVVACSLLKYCHWQRDQHGKNFELFYFTDREKREVDFVVTANRQPHWAVEVKSSDAQMSSALHYFCRRANPKAGGIQLVYNLQREQEKSGVRILDLSSWLDELAV